MYLVKTPRLVQHLFPNFVWNFPDTGSPEIYFTFDDGPHPDVTPWVLESLNSYNAEATFFSLGQNIAANPELFSAIRNAGHTAGNHSYSHPNGWETDYIEYFHDVRKGARIAGSDLFRPPFGKLLPGQARFLQRHYKIIMWDVLSGDFDETITPQQCYRNVVKYAAPGSIVVFHDTPRALKNLKYALPKLLDYFAQKNFTFKSVSPVPVIRRKSA